MSTMILIIASVYLVIGLAVGIIGMAHLEDGDFFDFGVLLFTWPVIVFILPGDIKRMNRQKELAAQDAHKAKRQQEILDRVIIEPEDPEKLRFEEVFSNMPLTYDGKVCYICRANKVDYYGTKRPLVNTVSNVPVHKECLIYHINKEDND